MTELHRALIVEDEPATAEDFREVLASIPCEVVVATNKHDALEHLKSQAFCFMLLDLQIKQDASAPRSHVEYGISLLREARKLFNAHSGRCYSMPIIVVTGSVFDVAFAVEIMRRGADDLLQKAVRPGALSEAVHAVLERSGRETHDQCNKPSVVPTTSKPVGVRLTIPGTREGRRTVVSIDNTTSALPNAALKTLLQLMVGHLSNEPVHKSDMNPREVNGFKEVSRLREQLRLPGNDGVELIENQHHGFYRLRPDLVIADCDTDALKQLEDRQISVLAGKLRELLDATSTTSPPSRRK